MKKPNECSDARMSANHRLSKHGLIAMLVALTFVCQGQPASAFDAESTNGIPQASGDFGHTNIDIAVPNVSTSSNLVLPASLESVIDASMSLEKDDPAFGDTYDTQSDVAKRKAAENGDKEAQFCMGLKYTLGDEKDPVQAIAWFQKAAEQGHPIAQYFLGLSYKAGDGVAIDPAKAADWFRKSAEQGFKDAQFEIGSCYAYGTGVEKDADQAFAWLRKAAEQESAKAQYILAECYVNGVGVDEDLAQAVVWYRKAAEQDDARSQHNLGIFYANGEGVEKDIGQAVVWWRKAAEQGFNASQQVLGDCYAKGDGIGKDLVQAAAWWRKAAEQGNASAQNNMGVCCATGTGVEKDLVQSVYWWSKAAEQGSANAQFALGQCYLDGAGVVQDDSQACFHFLIAGALGSPNAADKIKRLRDERLSANEYKNAKRQADEWVNAFRKGSRNDTSEPYAALPDPMHDEFTASGTGFVINSDGYFLTCAHVVEDGRIIMVHLGAKTYPAKLICVDVGNDIALLKLDGTNFHPLAFARDIPQMGDKVFTLGFPNPDFQGAAAKYTEGVISSLSGIMDDVRTMQITVPVQGGNSGGPLVDANGNVLGLVVAQLNAATIFEYTGDIPQNVNFAVKMNYALPLVQSVPEAIKSLPEPRASPTDSSLVEDVKAATGLVLVYE